MTESTVAPVPVQPALFASNNGTTQHLLDVPVERCRHSRFNTRKTRDPKAVANLAERIARMGFERTRALWAVQADDGNYEVFAGGTRLNAVMVAGLTTVPVMLHVGLAPEAISRKADEDNENDEYHSKVSPVDVWAEYARLEADEKWTQPQIAKAKGVDQPTVSRRLRFNTLPPRVKGWVCDGDLTEGHLEAISAIHATSHMATWLTSERAWEEVAALVVRAKKKDGKAKSVAATREDVKDWKAFIAKAEDLYRELDGYPKKAWNLAGAEPVAVDEDPAGEFVEALAKKKARSEAVVISAADAIKKRLASAARAYQLWLEKQNTEQARAAVEAEARQAVLDKFHKGDCVVALDAWAGGPIRLLLTDPPYGVAYRSNRRWASQAPARIAGDTEAEAMPLLAAAVDAALPHLAAEAHVLVFCTCEWQQPVRDVLSACGLTVKDNELIWAKEEHTAGDVKGGFGPSHEHLIHAVKGAPEVTPRIRDVLAVARTRETGHPHEKPGALLEALIKSTTTEGDLVADPFAGAASTLVAAHQAGRDFWGAEVEEGYHDEGSTRLLKAWEAGR